MIISLACFSFFSNPFFPVKYKGIRISADFSKPDSKASSNKEIDMDEKNSKVVDINVNKETAGGITLFEVLFYVISVVFAVSILNQLKIAHICVQDDFTCHGT
mgnify:CR=1 FL=1